MIGQLSGPYFIMEPAKLYILFRSIKCRKSWQKYLKTVHHFMQIGMFFFLNVKGMLLTALHDFESQV